MQIGAYVKTCFVYGVKQNIFNTFKIYNIEVILLTSPRANYYRVRADIFYFIFYDVSVLLECFAKSGRFYCTKEVGIAHSQEMTNNVSVDIPRWIIKESSMFWCSRNSNQDRIVPCTLNNNASGNSLKYDSYCLKQ